MDSASERRTLLGPDRVPFVPFNLLNYAAGMTGISLRSYVAATAIGILPGTVAYTRSEAPPDIQGRCRSSSP